MSAEFTRNEERSIVRAVDELARAAVERIAGKWAKQGFDAVTADPSATNPFNPPTHAAKCWEYGAEEARRAARKA